MSVAEEVTSRFRSGGVRLFDPDDFSVGFLAAKAELDRLAHQGKMVAIGRVVCGDGHVLFQAERSKAEAFERRGEEWCDECGWVDREDWCLRVHYVTTDAWPGARTVSGWRVDSPGHDECGHYLTIVRWRGRHTHQIQEWNGEEWGDPTAPDHLDVLAWRPLPTPPTPEELLHVTSN